MTFATQTVLKWLAILWSALIPSTQVFYTADASNYIFVSGSDFTTANNANFQTITGLTRAMPNNRAVNVSFHCALGWSQATANVSDNFGIQSANTAATNLAAFAVMNISGTGSLFVTGSATGIGSTAITTIGTAFPTATATIYNAYIDGTLESPSSGTGPTLTFLVRTSVGADAITIKRGSGCQIN